MTSLLINRGPDDEGCWVDPDGFVQFGFRRLSILDLSAAGHQPMISADGRSVLVFNGELYNFPYLRRELESHGHNFCSRTDSEVVLESINRWGAAALERFNGMFALACYDTVDKRLLLARDHAGIKPLYYALHPSTKRVAFASQFNCLIHSPWGRPGPLREDVLRLYLELHHIPPPYGLFENTYQLEPGHRLMIEADGSIEKRAWYTLPPDPEPHISPTDAPTALREALDGAVRRQRIADVPLGVFLSGGIDSPLVAAFARQQTDPSLKAFTIGSPGWWQDESAVASIYARHLDVDHRIHQVGAVDAGTMLETVAKAQTEPFADYSIFPTLLISEVSRPEITVALSGDGGDELFWGYERPLSLLRNGIDFRWPWPVRIGLYGAGKYGLGPSRSDVIVYRSPGHYYYDVNSRLKTHTLKRLAPEMASLPGDFDLYAFDGYRGERHLANYSRRVEFYGQLQRGLKKVDMASMHHSLEVRVPLLDREVIEVSVGVDPLDTMRGGVRKALLRNLLAEFVPAETIPQPKRGFAVPLGEWMRGDLRPYVEDILLGDDLYPAGLWNRQAVATYWQEHINGDHNHKWGLWTLIALQLWHRTHNL